MRSLHDELEQLKKRNLYRTLTPPFGVDLCSNDYLGYSTHPSIRSKMEESVRCWPLGSTGSRLLRGHQPLFESLEKELADFKGTEKAIVFNNGYMANLGLITTLIRPEDIVFSDVANHASLVDGILASRAKKVIYPHLDMDFLHSSLREAPKKVSKFVVTESLFSMDGDIAPLDKLSHICEECGARLIVDDAHAVGIFGNRGSGLVETFGVEKFVLAATNTCGKALGLFGAFVTGSEELVEYLINCCRQFIFTTALPPVVLAGIKEAILLVQNEPQRRRHVLDLAAWFREEVRAKGLSCGNSESHIVPIILGSSERTLKVQSNLQSQGYDVRAIRPPSVPEGSARLRVSINARLDRQILGDFLKCLKESLSLERTPA